MSAKSTSLNIADVIYAIDQPFRYVVTAGQFILCKNCCKSERKKIATDPLWLIERDAVNTHELVHCDNCNIKIQCKPNSNDFSGNNS